MMLINFSLAVALFAAAVPGGKPGPEGEELARRQARSVHLQWAAPAGDLTAVRGTVTVTQTQTNSYYMALGWATGYCGIQDLGSRRILIFSVWEPSDPYDFSARQENVKEEIRAKVLYSAPGVQVSRFGGEGTGAKTMTEIGWEVGKGVTVEVACVDAGETNRVAYTCSLREPDGSWRKLATISTLGSQTKLPGLGYVYSFVEDFWRNYRSAGLARRAEFTDFQVKTRGSEDWKPMRGATFTADDTPSMAIDAGRAKGGFFLATGGAVTNATSKLFDWIK